ncbi:MAG: chemotaxis protein CheX [Acidobacteria bacterium]|nr:chemotaxis protein CheX [Acidobacteriota bacterium]
MIVDASRDNGVRTALREAAVHVLETMFFISQAGENPAPEEAWPVSCYTARIVFRGGCAGAFTIRVPDSMARTVAANFLAEDEAGVPEEQVEEVVREFANMVCGATLSAVAPHASLDLAPPSIEAGLPPRGEIYSDSVLSECGRVEMRLEFWANV